MLYSELLSNQNWKDVDCKLDICVIRALTDHSNSSWDTGNSHTHNMLIRVTHIDLSIQVNLRTKFVFLVLSPKNDHLPATYYEEIGRSMAQLLTDKVCGVFVNFHKTKSANHHWYTE